MKTTIAVLRHAEYEQPADVPSAMLPWPLTAAGEMQARQAAREIQSMARARSLGIHEVFDSSRMLRAWQTASLIGDELGGEGWSINQFDALSERSVGSVANLTVAEIERILALDPRFEPPPPGWKSRSDFTLPFQGAESLLDAGARVAEHLNASARQMSADELKVIVGHGASIRHAMVYLGVMSLDDVRRYSMYHARPVLLEYDSVSHDWRHIDGDWKRRETASESDEYRPDPEIR